MLLTLTKEIIHFRLTVDKKDIAHDVYEGEVRMSQQQQDAYKAIIGDGNASVTISREVSESDYGKGGKVFVSITLTCDQSSNGLNAAIEYAKSLAETKVWEHHAAIKTQLIQRGILRP